MTFLGTKYYFTTTTAKKGQQKSVQSSELNYLHSFSAGGRRGRRQHVVVGLTSARCRGTQPLFGTAGHVNNLPKVTHVTALSGTEQTREKIKKRMSKHNHNQSMKRQKRYKRDTSFLGQKRPKTKLYAREDTRLA